MGFLLCYVVLMIDVFRGGGFADIIDMSSFVPDVPVTPDSGRWKPVVRGFSEGVEVLTSSGWVSLQYLMGAGVLGGRVPFTGNGYKVGAVTPKSVEFGQWVTGDGFPLVGSVDPVTGGVLFVKPSLFQWFRYDGWLVHVKGRGVDFLCSLFADLWVHPRYGRGFKFVPAGDIVRNRVSAAKYGVLNKFVVGDSLVDMYGEYSPESVLGGSVDGLVGLGGEVIDGVSSGLKVNLERPFNLIPKSHVSRVRVWDRYNFDERDEFGRLVKVDRIRGDVGVFNLVVPPFHNLIVRWGRKDDNPRTPWVGGPVVVGDGLDKSLLRVDGVLRGGNSLGGSYSVLGDKGDERFGGFGL